MVPDLPGLAHRDGVGVICAPRIRAYEVHAGAECRQALEIQAKIAFIEQPLAMEIDRVAQGGRAGSGASIGKDKDDLSIGRGDLPPVLAVLGWS